MFVKLQRKTLIVNEMIDYWAGDAISKDVEIQTQMRSLDSYR